MYGAGCDRHGMLDAGILAMNPNVDALESIPDSLLLIEPSGLIVFANRRVEETFGYTPTELCGCPLETLVRERLPPWPHQDIACEALARRRDGSEFPAEIKLSSARYADRVLLLALIRDVSDRKRVERELIAAREAADHASTAKSRFLATASHDLRQPLQSLSLLNGALRRLVTDPEIAEALAHQEQAITAMSQLVNALLDISKLESGMVRPHLSEFAITPLFEELHRELAPLATHKGLLLQVRACDCVVRSDSSLVGQILRNLLSNAIKYTREGTVLLRSAAGSDTCVIEVADTGIGIPADQMAHIYDEFFQVGTAPGELRQGYGLGLTIVSRIVSLLGLRLTAQSEPGRGSTFRLELPVSSARPGASVRDVGLELGRRRVLP
jgi:two-component system, sensor histidine kinase